MKNRCVSLILIIILLFILCRQVVDTSDLIVFDSDRDGSTEIYVLDLKTDSVTQITKTMDSHISNRFPDWSPDGDHIVFVSEDQEQRGDLFIIDIRGDSLKQITFQNALFENPAWAPDGEWIAFEMAHGNDWGLFLIKPDGSSLHRVGEPGTFMFHPSWSVDSKKIAVVTGDWDQWIPGILDLASGQLTLIPIDSSLNVGSVKWTGDGINLTIDAVRDDNFEIYIVDQTGDILQRIASHPAIDARPDWIRDGSQLIFHSTRDFGSVLGVEKWEEFELYLLDLPTKQVTRLTDNRSFDGHPDWCCDNND